MIVFSCILIWDLRLRIRSCNIRTKVGFGASSDAPLHMLFHRQCTWPVNSNNLKFIDKWIKNNKRTTITVIQTDTISAGATINFDLSVWNGRCGWSWGHWMSRYRDCRREGGVWVWWWRYRRGVIMVWRAWIWVKLRWVLVVLNLVVVVAVNTLVIEEMKKTREKKIYLFLWPKRRVDLNVLEPVFVVAAQPIAPHPLSSTLIEPK